MTTVSIKEAKDKLTALARRVEKGETVTVTRNGKPVFDLVPPLAMILKLFGPILPENFQYLGPMFAANMALLAFFAIRLFRQFFGDDWVPVLFGTAFMLTPEAKTTPLHRAALKQANDNSTTLTNVFTGRPARGIVNRYIREVGPMSDLAPAFPLAAGASQPMRAAAEKAGSAEFTSLWSGQAPTFAREMPAGDLVGRLVAESAEGARRFA